MERDYEDEGYGAGLHGDPLDACRLQKPDRRALWVRGWHRGREAAETAAAEAERPTISPEGRRQLAALRASLRD